jgi:hypothetical protein
MEAIGITDINVAKVMVHFVNFFYMTLQSVALCSEHAQNHRPEYFKENISDCYIKLILTHFRKFTLCCCYDVQDMEFKCELHEEGH